MAEFSEEELRRAAERVREMSRRASVTGGQHQRPPMPDFVSTPHFSGPRATEPQKDMHTMHKKSPSINSLFKMINFKGLEMDGDVSLILGIMLLISGEQTDELLSLALLYIMM